MLTRANHTITLQTILYNANNCARDTSWHRIVVVLCTRHFRPRNLLELVPLSGMVRQWVTREQRIAMAQLVDVGIRHRRLLRMLAEVLQTRAQVPSAL